MAACGFGLQSLIPDPPRCGTGYTPNPCATDTGLAWPHRFPGLCTDVLTPWV